MEVLDRQHCGRISYHKGHAAEAQVADMYKARGAEILATRWRGAGGEIDLILREKGTIVFVEVKSSRSHAQAAANLSARQQLRILSAAEEFIGGLPTGLLTEMRVDAALVSDAGVHVIEGALGL